MRIHADYAIGIEIKRKEKIGKRKSIRTELKRRLPKEDRKQQKGVMSQRSQRGEQRRKVALVKAKGTHFPAKGEKRQVKQKPIFLTAQHQGETYLSKKEEKVCGKKRMQDRDK